MDKKKYFGAEIVGILGPVFLGAWVWMEKHCGLPRSRSWWEGQGFQGHSRGKVDTDCWLRPGPVWKSLSTSPALQTEGVKIGNWKLEIGNWKLEASSRHVEMNHCFLSNCVSL